MANTVGGQSGANSYERKRMFIGCDFVDISDIGFYAVVFVLLLAFVPAPGLLWFILLSSIFLLMRKSFSFSCRCFLLAVVV